MRRKLMLLPKLLHWYCMDAELCEVKGVYELWGLDNLRYIKTCIREAFGLHCDELLYTRKSWCYGEH